MGNYQDAEAQPPDDDAVATEDPPNPLAAGALSAVYGRQVLVVTRRQYERRKISDPLFQRAEILDTHKIAQVAYKPARGKIGNVFGESGTRINVSLKTPSGRQIPLTIGSDSYVEELKYVLEKKEEIPIDYSRVVLVYGGKTMVEGERITRYGIRNNSVIDFIPELIASGPSEPVVAISDDLLDPSYDYDFSNKTDDGTEYFRGEHPYYRPYGWKRIALKVAGKYEDDIWLGKGGLRTYSSTGEWAVSYHGTKRDNVDSIARAGYDLSKCERFRYSVGIYSAPKIEVAESYATEFSIGNKEYKVVLQNRVCSTNLDIVRGGEYWVQPDDKLIRPYGFCIKEY